MNTKYTKKPFILFYHIPPLVSINIQNTSYGGEINKVTTMKSKGGRVNVYFI